MSETVTINDKEFKFEDLDESQKYYYSQYQILKNHPIYNFQNFLDFFYLT